MEAEVAPKATTLAFLVVSLLEAGYFVLRGIYLTLGPAYRVVVRLIDYGSVLPLSIFYISLGLTVSAALVAALLFARRLAKVRPVRPEPHPRVCATLGGSVLLILSFQLLYWGTWPLTAYAYNALGFPPYSDAFMEVVKVSKGLGPAFMIILAGLLIAVCLGMTRPRTAFLDEDHEVWGASDTKS